MDDSSDNLVDQPTLKPTSKVTAVGVGGGAATVLIAVLGLFGIELPMEVVAAILTLITFGAGYLKREKSQL